MVGPAESSTTGSSDVHERVLDAVADVRETNPIEFDRPLHDVLDPDALDELVRSADPGVRVEFTYLGYEITIDRDGEIALEPPGERRARD